MLCKNGDIVHGLYYETIINPKIGLGSISLIML